MQINKQERCHLGCEKISSGIAENLIQELVGVTNFVTLTRMGDADCPYEEVGVLPTF